MYVIDFNPFGEVTDSLLFTWEELTAEEGLSSADEDAIKTDVSQTMGSKGTMGGLSFRRQGTQ